MKANILNSSFFQRLACNQALCVPLITHLDPYITEAFGQIRGINRLIYFMAQDFAACATDRAIFRESSNVLENSAAFASACPGRYARAMVEILACAQRRLVERSAYSHSIFSYTVCAFRFASASNWSR